MKEGDPVEGPAVSITLYPGYLSDPGPPTRQYTPGDMRPPTHIQKRTAGMSSVREDIPNPQETGGPREFRGVVGWGLGVGTSSWRQGSREEVWDVEQSEGGQGGE